MYASARYRNVSTFAIGHYFKLDQFMIPYEHLYKNMPNQAYSNLDSIIRTAKKNLSRQNNVLLANYAEDQKNEAQFLQENASSIFFERIEIVRQYCCDTRPNGSDLKNEIKKIQKKLQHLFPNRVYYFFYEAKLKKLTSSCFLCSRWHLGDVEIRRGLDLDNQLCGRIASSNKLDYVVEKSEFFAIVKMFPMQKRIDILLDNKLDKENIQIIYQTFLSDLVEEIEIYKKESWSGNYTKTVLKARLVSLEGFFRNKDLNKLKEIEESQPLLKSLFIQYGRQVRNLTKWYDYLWFCRNRRILRAICESAIKKAVKTFFSKQEAQEIRDKISEVGEVLPPSQILNPYMNFLTFHSQLKQNTIIDINQIIPPNYREKKADIRVRENQFKNEQERQKAIKKVNKKCHYEFSEFWEENSNINYDAKELSRKTKFEIDNEVKNEAIYNDDCELEEEKKEV